MCIPFIRILCLAWVLLILLKPPSPLKSHWTLCYRTFTSLFCAYLEIDPKITRSFQPFASEQREGRPRRQRRGPFHAQRMAADPIPLIVAAEDTNIRATCERKYEKIDLLLRFR